MAGPAYNWEELIEWGTETGYGAGGTQVRAARPLSNGLITTDPPLPMNAPSGAPVAFMHDTVRPRDWKAHADVRGPLEFHLDCEDIPDLIIAAVGGRNLAAEYQKTGPTDVTAYTHIAQMPVTPSAGMPPGKVMWDQNGQEDRLIRGLMVDTMEIIGDESDLVRARFDLIGQTFTRGNVGTVATIGTTPLFSLYESILTMDLTGPGAPTSMIAKGNIQKWSFKIENGLRALPVSGVGVRGIRKPDYAGYRKVTFTFTTDWESDQFQDLWDQIQAPNSYITLQMDLTSGEDIAGTAASTKYQHTLYIPAAKCIGAPPTHSGGGDVVPEELTFEAAAWMNTGVMEVMTYTAVNGESGDYVT